MSTNRNSNGNGWKKFWIILSTCITTGGIGFGFHCLRENKKTREAKKRADYFYQKKLKIDKNAMKKSRPRKKQHSVRLRKIWK